MTQQKYQQRCFDKVFKIHETVRDRKYLFITIIFAAIVLTVVFVWQFLNHIGDIINVSKTFDAPEIEIVFVEGGTFKMGCTSEQGDDCLDDEKPAHRVTVSDFYIGKYAVTQAQWRAVMGDNPSNFKGDNLPVESLSWNDAQEFIRRLNTQTGKLYRLPTEAEWEFAARGGNSSGGYKYSGSHTADNVAWYYENAGNRILDSNAWDYDTLVFNNNKSHPVGTKSPNELGIYDMSGNVFEWCNDWYGAYSSNAQTDPLGPSSGSYRIIRGGCCYDNTRVLRVSSRSASPSDFRDYFIGFRLACSSR